MKHRGSTASGPQRIAKTSRSDPLVDPQPAQGHQPPRMGRRQRFWTSAAPTLLWCRKTTLTRKWLKSQRFDHRTKAPKDLKDHHRKNGRLCWSSKNPKDLKSPLSKAEKDLKDLNDPVFLSAFLMGKGGGAAEGGGAVVHAPGKAEEESEKGGCFTAPREDLAGRTVGQGAQL